MSEADHMTKGANAFYHPVSHYDSPVEVLNDEMLSGAEKRIILSSWASDMYALEANPSLRAIPGVPRPMRLHDILAALRRLDEGHDPPPRGAAAMRPVRWTSLKAVARHKGVPAAMDRGRLISRKLADSARWTRDANVQRYRRLLATELTERERQFVERRLAEELQAADHAPPVLAAGVA